MKKLTLIILVLILVLVNQYNYAWAKAQEEYVEVTQVVDLHPYHTNYLQAETKVETAVDVNALAKDIDLKVHVNSKDSFIK